MCFDRQYFIDRPVMETYVSLNKNMLEKSLNSSEKNGGGELLGLAWLPGRTDHESAAQFSRDAFLNDG